MQLIITKNLAEIKPEIVFFPVLEDALKIDKIFNQLESAESKLLLARCKRENFQGKAGQIFIIHKPDRQVVILGTGQKQKLNLEDWRVLAGQMISYLKKYQAKNVGISASSWLLANQNYEALALGLAEGLFLASYDFDKYRKPIKDQIKIKIENLFIELASAKKNKFISAWQVGELQAKATILARDLVNEPANIMTPTFLANIAKDIAKKSKQIRVRILEKEAVLKLGMGAFVGVDQGSQEDLKFIHLVYKPKTKPKDRLALVGKGVTFDSGGLNIKTGDHMGQMKIDMAGAATVLGVFSSLTELNIKSEVHGIIAACENMPSGSALRPGDIVKNMQGKTIEIGNTDAEGRVTLADSLAYAQKLGIKKIIDLATLTGAIMVALGTDYAGLFSNDEELSKDLLKASKQSAEKIWPLPLAPEYKHLNASLIADIRNIPSNRLGGAITAALFLQEFVNEDVAWAHLDIAAPAYAEKTMNAYTPVGGVGFGVRTILEYLKK